jgi:hypothetical protein
MTSERVSPGAWFMAATLLTLVGANMVSVSATEEPTSTAGYVVTFEGTIWLDWSIQGLIGYNNAQSFGTLKGYKDCISNPCTWHWEHDGPTTFGGAAEAECRFNGSTHSGILLVAPTAQHTPSETSCNMSSKVEFYGEIRPDEQCAVEVYGFGQAGSVKILASGTGLALCNVFAEPLE